MRALKRRWEAWLEPPGALNSGKDDGAPQEK
jgi:hypothetical protein